MCEFLNWSLSTLQLIIERHSSTGIMNEWWNWGKKNETKKRLACYFLHPKFSRKENLLSTWQCWTTCTQWTVSSGMKFVCDWSIILSRNLSHVSVSGSLLCDQILFLLNEWIIDDKWRSHHFQEMNQLSMNNRSAKPLYSLFYHSFFLFDFPLIISQWNMIFGNSTTPFTTDTER